MNATAMQECAPVPGHVAPGSVYDFDFRRDAEMQRDPHERCLRLTQEAPPIFYTPRNGGHWVIAGYDLVRQAVSLPTIFSSRAGPGSGGESAPALLPLFVDPPIHKLYREPLNLAFGAKAMRQLEAQARGLARGLIAGVADAGGCEFVADVAEPLPVTIFLQMMGMPVDRTPEFREAVRANNSADKPDEQLAALLAIGAIMEEFIVARRDDRRDDLISRLWSLDIDGRPITIEEMRNYCILLFVAGLDTVINATAFAIRHLARDHDLQHRLRSEPALIPAAIEEMLRRYGIVATPRLVAEDVELGGVRLRSGDAVLLMLPAANLDPGKFARPADYDLTRTGGLGHITFNFGPHHCVGMHLARLELRILYEEWLCAIPQFSLVPERPPRFQVGNIFTVQELPLRWG